MAGEKPATFYGRLDRMRQYLEEGPSAQETARPRLSWLHTTGQFIWLVLRGFNDNRGPLRAAGLSFSWLRALVPMLAVVLSVSKNFLHTETANLVPQLLDRAIATIAPQLEYMPDDDDAPAAPAKAPVTAPAAATPSPASAPAATPAPTAQAALASAPAAPDKPADVVVSSKARQEVVDRIQSFIGNINAGALGTIGTILLIVVAIQMMMSIEQSFNDIWGIAQGRPIWQKVVYYWATITLGPLLLLMAVAFTGTMEFSQFLGRVTILPWLQKAVLFLMPFVVLWTGFGLMYALMPNTRVTWRAAFIGGIVGGTLWQLNSILSTLYISRVVGYSKIYGSIGIIPVFLLGLYFGWYIVLLGAQSYFVAQNLRSFLLQRASDRVDQEGRELIGCRIVLLACQRFLHGRRAPAFEETATTLGVPAPLLNRLARRLVEGGVLVEVTDEARNHALQPARPPDQITINDVLHVLRTTNGLCGDTTGPAVNDAAGDSLRALYAAASSSPANARFSDLAARTAKPA
ncbi:MAG: YihY/virulence factor BrkB family protein [Verrucomicrobia bacterium]|nr:YihY/virulence factor BrkB family protein [Verrucomicrobiota bacterium]